MKTLKDAYMSVGLVPAIGDKIGDPIDFELENGITLTWVDGWFCDFATSCAGLLVYNAGRYKCCKILNCIHPTIV